MGFQGCAQVLSMKLLFLFLSAFTAAQNKIDLDIRLAPGSAFLVHHQFKRVASSSDPISADQDSLLVFQSRGDDGLRFRWFLPKGEGKEEDQSFSYSWDLDGNAGAPPADEVLFDTDLYLQILVSPTRGIVIENQQELVSALRKLAHPVLPATAQDSAQEELPFLVYQWFYRTYLVLFTLHWYHFEPGISYDLENATYMQNLDVHGLLALTGEISARDADNGLLCVAWQLLSDPVAGTMDEPGESDGPLSEQRWRVDFALDERSHLPTSIRSSWSYKECGDGHVSQQEMFVRLLPLAQLELPVNTADLTVAALRARQCREANFAVPAADVTQLNNQLLSWPDWSKGYLARGLDLEYEGYLTEAERDFTQAIRFQVWSGEAFLARGRVRASLARFHDALADLVQATRLLPTSAEAWREKALIQLEMAGRVYDYDRYFGALVSADRALDLEPQSVATWLMKSNALSNLGRGQQALAIAEHVCAIDPLSDRGWREKGIILDRLGRFQEALAAFHAAVLLHPGNSENRSLANLARSSWLQQRFGTPVPRPAGLAPLDLTVLPEYYVGKAYRGNKLKRVYSDGALVSELLAYVCGETGIQLSLHPSLEGLVLDFHHIDIAPDQVLDYILREVGLYREFNQGVLWFVCDDEPIVTYASRHGPAVSDVQFPLSFDQQPLAFFLEALQDYLLQSEGETVSFQVEKATAARRVSVNYTADWQMHLSLTLFNLDQVWTREGNTIVIHEYARHSK